MSLRYSKTLHRQWFSQSLPTIADAKVHKKKVFRSLRARVLRETFFYYLKGACSPPTPLENTHTHTWFDNFPSYLQNWLMNKLINWITIRKCIFDGILTFERAFVWCDWRRLRRLWVFVALLRSLKLGRCIPWQWLQSHVGRMIWSRRNVEKALVLMPWRPRIMITNTIECH